MHRQDTEVADPSLLGALNHGRDSRRRGLKSNTEKDHLTILVLLRQAKAVIGRINDPDVGPLASLFQQGGLRSRYSKQITKSDDPYLLFLSQGNWPVDFFDGSDTDGTTRTRNQGDVVGQKISDAVSNNRYRVRSAHLHEFDRFVGSPSDLLNKVANTVWISILVNVLHDRSLKEKGKHRPP